MVTETRSVPGKHYHCSRCGREWQNRTVLRYRRRVTVSKKLLQVLLERKDQLSLRDRFFIEKTGERGELGLKRHKRLVGIAHKIGIDLREEVN